MSKRSEKSESRVMKDTMMFLSLHHLNQAHGSWSTETAKTMTEKEKNKGKKRKRQDSGNKRKKEGRWKCQKPKDTEK